MRILHTLLQFVAQFIPVPALRHKLLRFGAPKQVTEKMQFGKWGEDQAAQYLEKSKGYKVVQRNWYYGNYELDIIAYQADKIIFVEVKTRSTGPVGSGYYAVGGKKRHALRKAGIAYLRRLKKVPSRSQFDIVEVIAGSKEQEPEIYHYEDLTLTPRNSR
jgi:putative endonuclease